MMNVGAAKHHKESEIGKYFVDEGNYIYRMTKNGKEIIAKAETYPAAEFIVMAISSFKKYELQ